MSRHQIILFAVIGCAMLLALAGLRAKPEKAVALHSAHSDHDPQAIEHDGSASSRSRNGGVRVGRLGASEERPRNTEATTRTARVATLPPSEDYDSQVDRAVGDSRLYGFVRGRDGKPLNGAQLELYENDPMTENPPLRTTATDSEGSYTIHELNDSDRYYILVARAEGHAPEAQRVHMPQRPVRADVRLSNGVPLSGHVRDVLTSGPVSGATVYHPARGGEVFAMLGKAMSGAHGEFSFPLVRSGRVRAQATAPGYRRTTRALTAPSDDAEIPMHPGGATIRGETVSRLTEKPVGGAKVVLTAPGLLLTTLSKEGGAFEFEDLPGGKYEIYALRGGVRTEKTELQLGDMEVKEDVTIVVADNLFVSGRVERSGSGEPLPGIQLWFKSDRGKKAVVSDETGRFGFETLALDEYTIEVHERNMLPVQDQRTSSAVETITRKVPPGASSDEVVIRLRRTRSVSGFVTAARGPNRNKARIWGADVVVDYKIGEFYERVRTRTDTKGNFFVNLPNQRRGDARISAIHRGLVSVVNTRVPSRRPIEVELKSTYLRGRLVLSDATPLTGVRLRTRNFLYPGRDPDSNFPLPGTTIYTGVGGGFNIPVGEKQKVEVTFELPDERKVTKTFDTDQLISRRRTFVYDPVAGDIVTDVGRSRQGGGQAQQPRQNGQGRNPGAGGNRRPGNNTPRPASQQR